MTSKVLILPPLDCCHIPLEDDSVDLVFCSPPYEDARTYGIDFKFRGQAWVDWAMCRFMESLRVCRGLVAWVVEGKTKDFSYSATPALLMADLKRAGVTLRKPAAFHRIGVPGSGGPDWLRNDYEIIICATKGGKLPWSDNIACGHPPKWAPGGEMSNRLKDGRRKNRNQWGGTKKNGKHRKSGGEGTETYERPSHIYADKLHTKTKADGSMETQGYSVPVLANPGNVIEAPPEVHEAGDITKHIVGGGIMGHALAHENEAPFPESLAAFFIRSFCPPEGIVLDPFCGSGTTGAAALRHGRNAILADLRASQCDLSDRRIKAQFPDQQVIRLIDQNTNGIDAAVRTLLSQGKQ